MALHEKSLGIGSPPETQYAPPLPCISRCEIIFHQQHQSWTPLSTAAAVAAPDTSNFEGKGLCAMSGDGAHVDDAEFLG